MCDYPRTNAQKVIRFDRRSVRSVSVEIGDRVIARMGNRTFIATGATALMQGKLMLVASQRDPLDRSSSMLTDSLRLAQYEGRSIEAWTAYRPAYNPNWFNA